MLPRVAACCFAVCVIAWPGYAGGDTDTFWNSPSAAVLSQADMLAAPQAPNADVTAVQQAPAALSSADAAGATAGPAPAAAQRTQIADATDLGADDKAGLQPQNDEPVDASKQMAALDPAEPAAPSAAQPFDLPSVSISTGNVITKWAGVEADIRAGNKILARCRDDAQLCSKAAQNFLAIVAQGRAQTGLARIGVINRAVNLAIEPMSDMAQWGVPDRWSAPLETFTTTRGDCEDYAIAKYVALIAAGVPAEDVKLVIIRNTAANEDHAVVDVRNGRDWIILDNRWLAMVKDVDMRNAIPRFVLDDAGVRRFAAPQVATRRASDPASLGL
jgi:predicted transglutaminase-like cysteine proteinase